MRVVRNSALRTWKLLQRTGNGAAELSHELYLPAVVELGEERAVMFHNVSRLLLKSRPYCIQTQEINGLSVTGDNVSTEVAFIVGLIVYYYAFFAHSGQLSGQGRGFTPWGCN